MKVYLVDYIGMHCGMHYYNMHFAGFCLQFQDWIISVLSNYADKNTNKPFFLHQYKGCKLRKICCLLWNYLMLLGFVLRNRKSCFQFIWTYGAISH